MKSLRFIYKLLWYSLFMFKNTMSTYACRFLLTVNNVHYGKGLKALGGVIPMLRINRFSSVTIGNGCIFNSYNDVAWYSKCCLWTRPNAILTIGNNTGFNGALIYCSSRITIGDNVLIGGGTKIFDTDFHPLDYKLRREGYESSVNKSPIVIEDDVFIGTQCLILRGVHIGARSVVAAGSVVTKNIGTDELWGGCPAKKIKKLKK